MFKHIAAVFIGAASYGVLSTFVVLAYDRGYSLGEVVGSQQMVGFLLTAMFAWYIRQRESTGAWRRNESVRSNARGLTQLTWTQRLILMAAGMPTAITGLFYYHSLRYIPASLAILLLFQFTWIGVVVQAVRQRKRPSLAVLISLLILFTGTMLAAGLLEQGAGRFNMIGIALGLMAAVSYTLFLLLSGKAVPEAHPAYRGMWMMMGAMLMVFVLFPPRFLIDGSLWSDLMLFALLLGVFGALLPPVLFAYGVPHIGEGMAAILGAAELPMAVLLSTLVLREDITLLQWGGVAIILFGVAYPELMRRRRKGAAAVS
ncbi:DMT family transporter [Paenibacillus sp. J5C_2022]|uniref:EamA family transporter n=1 Tax=Paenibacillus sp. J5C2022 TaxID=2977129 RepID=UPI0021D3A1A5|nr:DMT family transporter [Paenibacillus sp. J5C2022]MCU6708144.1 DMT family transporter [Paenibacillus sp. J5C2022]